MTQEGADEAQRPEIPQGELAALAQALGNLRDRDPELAATLSRLFRVVAAEAARGPRFAKALSGALHPRHVGDQPALRSGRPSNRRNPGPFDPFAVYAEGGETALRERLTGRGLEELRDIVAEHGMDTDRLAMKWKDPQRVMDRIVERVIDRSEKGSAFR